MAAENVRLLLVRPHDQVVAAVRLVGFQIDGDTVTAAEPSILELTFPPQSTGELVYDPVAGLAGARLGGTSRASFQIDPGTTATLSAEGILTMAGAGQPLSEPGPVEGAPTVLEIPWRLAFAPRPTATGDRLLWTIPATPLLGASGAAGLWHVRLEAVSGLSLVPLEGDAGDFAAPGGEEAFVPPLHRGQRDQIRAHAGFPQEPPTAPFMDISPLGGTLSAKGRWPDFAWEQEVVLGRDMFVKTETKGFLYPWGHQAVLIDATRRVPTPETGPAVAGLQQVKVLLVADPIRRGAANGEPARAFPFDEVEILHQATEVGPDDPDDPPETRRRPPKRLEQLKADLGAKEAARDAQDQVVAGLPDQRLAEIDEWERAEIGIVDAAFAEFAQRLTDLEAAAAASSSPPVRRSPPTDPPIPILEREPPHGHVPDPLPPPPEPGPAPLSSAEAAELAALQQRAAELSQRLVQIQTEAAAARQAPRGEEDLLALGGTYAEQINLARQLRSEFDELSALVEGILQQAAQDLRIFEWPQAKTGGRLTVPIRCDGVRTTTPVLFVHDHHFPENEDFPEFAPLRNKEVLGRIDEVWRSNESRRLPVPGVPVDFVRAGPDPLPADVLPVHELTVGGRFGDDGFRAVIDEAKVVLRAATELVPKLEGMTRVAFDREFLLSGRADKFALRLPDGLDVDFRQAADKSGGLISPDFTADVLSRVHGPVDERMLPGLPQPPDLAAAFKDATILGIPLASIVDEVSLPEPLSIVSEPDGGARMSWNGVALKSNGPFVAEPGRTKLDLTVVRSPAETKVECRIESFELVLPPGGDLVRLHFDALTFLQRPNEAPDLVFEGFELKLGGVLDLLKTLQDHVPFGSAAPAVRSAPGGMHAGYSIAVPEVAAGMFVMKNIAVSAGVEVPFDGRPIVTSLAFASRDDPFGLAVSLFGGTGYLLFEIAEKGEPKLEASLDFGASVAISVGVASAEVHALGGVQFTLDGNVAKVTGFLRIGGSVDVFGLVSVSVELRVELAYEEGVLSGRATAVVEIDVTFWSGSVELDSGEYTFAGATAADPRPPGATVQTHDPSLSDWQRYRDKFGAA